jgi:hypothetical protein
MQDEIITGLSRFIENRNPEVVQICRVTKVGEDVVTVALHNEFEVIAQLQTNDAKNRFVAIPQLGSYVVVLKVANRWIVIMTSDVQSVKVTIGTATFEMGKDEIKFGKSNETLKGVLVSLVSELTKSFTQINTAIALPTNTPNYVEILTKIQTLFG